MKNNKKNYFSVKNLIFRSEKNIFLIWNKVYSDRYELDLSDKPSELKISISVESYYEITAENYGNGYVAKKRMVAKLSNISIPNKFIEKLLEMFPVWKDFMLAKFVRFI